MLENKNLAKTRTTPVYVELLTQDACDCARSASGCVLKDNAESTGYIKHLVQEDRISGQPE